MIWFLKHSLIYIAVFILLAVIYAIVPKEFSMDMFNQILLNFKNLPRALSGNFFSTLLVFLFLPPYLLCRWIFFAGDIQSKFAYMVMGIFCIEVALSFFGVIINGSSMHFHFDLRVLLAGAIYGLTFWLLEKLFFLKRKSSEADKIEHAQLSPSAAEKKKTHIKIAKALLTLTVIIIIGWKIANWRYQLSFIPPELEVSTVIYAQNGPWGMATPISGIGVFIYEMPDATVKKINDGGIGYVLSLSKAARQNFSPFPMDLDRNWHATPMTNPLEDWQKSNYPEKIQERVLLGLDTINIDSDLEINLKIARAINTAISTSGSFYVHNNASMIVLSPSTQRIFYVYTGYRPPSADEDIQPQTDGDE